MSDTDFPSPPEEAPELPATETARLRRRGVRSLVRKFFLFLILGVIILASVEGVGLWRDHFRDYKSTNNAYVQATVVPVRSQGEGAVSELLGGSSRRSPGPPRHPP